MGKISKISSAITMFLMANMAFAGTTFSTSGPYVNINLKQNQNNYWKISSADGVTSIQHPRCTGYGVLSPGNCYRSEALHDATVQDTYSALTATLVRNNAICIGGEQCGRDNFIQLNYPQSYVQKISIFAHDGISDVTKAHLQVFVNGVLIGEKDVLRDGSWLEFPVNRYVSSIYLKSVRDTGASTGDETAIQNITSY